MSNIHGMSDYNRPTGNSQQSDEEAGQAMFGTLIGGGRGISKQPRDYNYWDFWTSTFCPNFNPYAFPFVIWAIISLYYLAVLVATPFISS